jgi:hypothetical protein
MVNRKYTCEGGNIDEKYDTLGILSCWNRYSFLISLLFLLSLLAVASLFRLEIFPYRPKDVASLSLFRDVDPDCSWNPGRQILFSGIERPINIQER